MAGRIARGDIRFYQFAPPDKKKSAVVLTRNSAIAYLSTVTVAKPRIKLGLQPIPGCVFLRHQS